MCAPTSSTPGYEYQCVRNRTPVCQCGGGMSCSKGSGGNTYCARVSAGYSQVMVVVAQGGGGFGGGGGGVCSVVV